jgi:ABC-type spermidine/putrescine transport system permease subunit II
MFGRLAGFKPRRSIFPIGLGEDSFKELGMRIPFLRACLWMFASVVIALAVIPSVYLFIWAFYGTEIVGLLSSTPSLRWFSSLLLAPEWQQSLAYSVLLASVSAVVGTVILVVHFYFMRFATPVFDRIAYVFLILSVTLPAVIYALSLRVARGSWGMPETFLVFVGTVVSILPIQFFCLESAQETVSTELVFAGNTLGASHWRNILFVYLPMLRKAAWTAFLVGFFFAFDELVISTFVIDSSLVTVPRRLWDQVHHSMEPMPAVTSCCLVLVYVGLWVTMRMRRVVRRGGVNCA